MGNCIIAQSGGPSSVINATLAGIVKANQTHPIYTKVYGGIHGIEGILAEQFVDITDMSEEENKILCQTPSSALGSCRYKLKRSNEADFINLFAIMDRYDITTMFYIGGNDSMDTIVALSEYAKCHGIEGRQFIGCPKTVDNDLCFIDHCPGYGSAAKYIATTALQTWLDVNCYTREEVFILETMGRDAGWLAASATLSGKVDLLVLPEVPFEKQSFYQAVRECLAVKNKCYIVVSEGARYGDGTYLSSETGGSDAFGHAVLGGAGQAIKDMLLRNGITKRAKVQDLSTAQRCHATEDSLVDVKEAFALGRYAHKQAEDPNYTCRMVGMLRKGEREYAVEYIDVDAHEVANVSKKFPKEWILDNYQGVSEEALNYMKPLIQGKLEIIYKDGLPAFMEPYTCK